MEFTVKTKFDIGDKVEAAYSSGIFTSYINATIIDIKMRAGIYYLVERDDKTREWVMECYVRPPEEPRITVDITADNVGVLDKIKEMFK